MTNADLEFNLILSWIPIRMNYSDLDAGWYHELGPQIVKTVFILAFTPYVSLVVSYVTKKPLQWLDSGFPCCKPVRKLSEQQIQDMKDEHELMMQDMPEGDRFPFEMPPPSTARVTKLTTAQSYVNMYAGPEYILYSQYSQMLVLIFVTFMYGILMPILFPICLFGIINISIVDRWSLTYFFRAPPNYDGKLNEKALSLMSCAPVFMFGLGYWALSNTSMFLNIAPEKIWNNRPVNPRHNLIDTDVKNNLNGGHLSLVVLFLWIIRVYIWAVITKGCAKGDDDKDDAYKP